MSAPAPAPAKHVHQVFVVYGIVDEAVVRKQAFERATRPVLKRGDVIVSAPEATAIHKHKHGRRCNESCYLVKVGESE